MHCAFKIVPWLIDVFNIWAQLVNIWMRSMTRYRTLHTVCFKLYLPADDTSSPICDVCVPRGFVPQSTLWSRRGSWWTWTFPWGQWTASSLWPSTAPSSERWIKYGLHDWHEFLPMLCCACDHLVSYIWVNFRGMFGSAWSWWTRLWISSIRRLLKKATPSQRTSWARSQ